MYYTVFFLCINHYINLFQDDSAIRHTPWNRKKITRNDRRVFTA